MAKAHESRHRDVILSSAGVTASLVLADPTIYLSGFTGQEQAERPPALVRGSLILRISKATKIKAINLCFRGVSRTEWPEGIPSDKSETHETKEVFTHEWRLFSTQFPNAEKSSGAHSVSALDSNGNTVGGTGGVGAGTTGGGVGGGEQNPLGPGSDTDTILQPATTTSHELVNQHDAVSKGYRVFNPAEYLYNIELMLPQRLPETMKCNFGSVRWGFALTIERHGTFKPNLTAHKEVTLLRTLGPSNLERSEPIVISRDWEDLLHYEIIIAGKAFSIGDKFNVAFSLVPLAKVKCHRIRIYITEHTEYFCRNRRIHRVEPSHKFLLMERKSPDGSRGDLLNSVEHGNSSATEFEFNVEIPETFPSRRDYLRPNANTEYIKVYHWIKAVMRLSRQDVTHNGEPKCYEVSIDSPITLVDPRTNFANELPDYQTARSLHSIADVLKPYQEYIQKESMAAAQRNGEMSAALTAVNNNTSDAPAGRAILFGRQPSIAPPPFDADVRPPELLPPPQYDVSKDSVQLYEQKYEEYLIATGRLPPAHDRIDPTALAPENLSDSTSDSRSTISHKSESGSGSTLLTAPEEEEVPDELKKAARKPDAVADEHDDKSGDSKSGDKSGDESGDSKPADKSADKPAGDKPVDKPRRKKSQAAPREPESVPVFSEIIWSEDAVVDADYDDLVDPRTAHVMRTSEVPALPSPSSPLPTHFGSNYFSGASPAFSSAYTGGPHAYASAGPSPTSSSVISPSATSPASSPSSPPPALPNNAGESPSSPSVEVHKRRSSGRAQRPVVPPIQTSTSTDAETTGESAPRPIPKQSRGNAFNPPMSHNQKMRSSVGERGAGPLFPGGGSVSGGSGGASFSARRSSMQGPRSLKTPTPMSISAGSPLTSPWSQSDSNAPQLFSDRWMDRRDSSGSFAGSPRYFRQSSVVSMDVTRQGAAGDHSLHRESSWSSRRPSRLSEVQELNNWYPLHRRDSENSVAISIAEYQGLSSERQGANTPLLGDEESEMDLGLEWENDFEDYDWENDRRSVVSAFYTVMTP